MYHRYLKSSLPRDRRSRFQIPVNVRPSASCDVACCVLYTAASEVGVTARNTCSGRLNYHKENLHYGLHEVLLYSTDNKSSPICGHKMINQTFGVAAASPNVAPKCNFILIFLINFVEYDLMQG